MVIFSFVQNETEFRTGAWRQYSLAYVMVNVVGVGVGVGRGC